MSQLAMREEQKVKYILTIMQDMMGIPPVRCDVQVKIIFIRESLTLLCLFDILYILVNSMLRSEHS